MRSMKDASAAWVVREAESPFWRSNNQLDRRGKRGEVRKAATYPDGSSSFREDADGFELKKAPHNATKGLSFSLLG